MCCLRPGTASNRKPCVHESEIIGFVKGANENITCREVVEVNPGSNDSNEDFTTNGMNVIEGCMENSSEVVQILNINYISRRKRSFFPCFADEKSNRRLMSVILCYQTDKCLFFGRSISFKCSDCGHEMSPSCSEIYEKKVCFTLVIMELFQSKLLTFYAIIVIKLMPKMVYIMVCFVGQKPYLCERTHGRVSEGNMWNWWQVPGHVFIVGFKTVVY